MVALIHLHGVAQGSGGSGDDGDLLHRCGVGLLRGDQRMSDLMVGHNFLFLIRQDGVLLLVSGDNHLDAFFQIRLGYHLTSVTHRAQGGFVDDVGKFRAGSAGSHAGNHREVHIGIHLHLLRMHLQDLFTSLQVRKFHGHPSVKPAGTEQSRIQRFRTVGGRQNDNARISFKSIHFRQQLVQGLFAFVVSAVLAVTLLADGVDLIDEYDTGSLLLCLPEQVTHLGCAHADEHFHEFRTGDGEERHIRLTGNRLRQHGFTGSGRAHKQDALGHGGADFLILLRIMQIIDDLGQVFLRLILTRHIAETDARGRLHVNLRIALSHAEHHGVSAHFVHRPLIHPLADGHKDHNGQHPGNQKAHDGRRLLYDFGSELSAGVMQTFRQTRIIHQTRFVNLGIVLIGEKDLVILNLHLTDILLFRHIHEGAVIHFDDLCLQHSGHHQKIQQQQNEHHYDIIKYKWFFGSFYLIHSLFSFPLPRKKAVFPPPSERREAHGSWTGWQSRPHIPHTE